LASPLNSTDTSGTNRQADDGQALALHDELVHGSGHQTRRIVPDLPFSSLAANEAVSQRDVRSRPQHVVLEVASHPLREL
jgi:hypothetical protein